MRRYLAPLFCAVLILAAWATIDANAQGKGSVRSHLAAAKAAGYEPGNDLTVLYDTVCEPALSQKGPVQPNILGGPGDGANGGNRIPPRSAWYTEPAKVFDNLSYVGEIRQSTWAVTTSEGIILIDSAFDYSVKERIQDGFKTLHLDPAQIKYVINTHAHNDRFAGSRWIQDTYHAHVVMSDKDWTTIEKDKNPENIKPKRDIVATDGMKLTLGDTTLTLYLTPGHTPGTVSVLVPLKDGNQKHLGAVWGGINPDMGRMGVQYFSGLTETFKTWSTSAKRFQDIANKEGADVYLTLHPFYDKALDKMHALNFRKPGDPHPFVSKSNLNRFLTIIRECTEAQLARITS